MTNKNKSYTTKNYEQFRLHEFNRQLNEAHVKKLQISIQKHGQLEPIRCDDKGVVIDGQHRLEALKRLDREVWVMVKPSLDMSQVVELNRMRKSWTFKDYAHHYAAQGIEPYVQVEWLLNVFPDLPAMEAAHVVAGVHLNTTSYKAGTMPLSTSCFVELEDRAAFMSLICRHCEAQTNRRTIYIFCMNDELAQSLNLRERLTAQLRKHDDHVIAPQTKRKEDVLRALEHICNYHVRSNKKVRLF